jgi:hypothetical protein
MGVSYKFVDFKKQRRERGEPCGTQQGEWEGGGGQGRGRAVIDYLSEDKRGLMQI